MPNYGEARFDRSEMKCLDDQGNFGPITVGRSPCVTGLEDGKGFDDLRGYAINAESRQCGYQLWIPGCNIDIVTPSDFFFFFLFIITVVRQSRARRALLSMEKGRAGRNLLVRV
jgi:hypothetical protein